MYWPPWCSWVSPPPLLQDTQPLEVRRAGGVPWPRATRQVRKTQTFRPAFLCGTCKQTSRERGHALGRPSMFTAGLWLLLISLWSNTLPSVLRLLRAAEHLQHWCWFVAHSLLSGIHRGKRGWISSYRDRHLSS